MSRKSVKISRIIKTVCICTIIAILAYDYGYSQGQASVYTKASNDKKLMHILYGKDNK